MKKIQIPTIIDTMCFFSDKLEVNSLEIGAKLYGGATRFDNKIYSNVEKSDYVLINEGSLNTISIVVPSTVNVDDAVNNDTLLQYTNSIFDMISKKYPNNLNVNMVNSQGSWYSDDLCKTVVEDVTLITVITNNITELDIKFFDKIAQKIKNDMSQEAVSIFVNDSLAIV